MACGYLKGKYSKLNATNAVQDQAKRNFVLEPIIWVFNNLNQKILLNLGLVHGLAQWLPRINIVNTIIHVEDNWSKKSWRRDGEELVKLLIEDYVKWSSQYASQSVKFIYRSAWLNLGLTHQFCLIAWSVRESWVGHTCRLNTSWL